MSSEPLILDANGDDVADLFGSQVGVDGSKRSLWLFGKDRTQGPEVVDLTEDQPSSSSSLVAGVIPEPYERFRRPHSNAFVDLNTDGNADLFVTAKDRFELWENVGGSSGSENKHFKKHKEIRYPECKEGDKVGFISDRVAEIRFPFCGLSERWIQCTH